MILSPHNRRTHRLNGSFLCISFHICFSLCFSFSLIKLVGKPFHYEGSHTSWKVMEFKKGMFQAWKVMKKSWNFLTVLRIIILVV